MKLVVTGASGFVGEQIVPILLRHGAELLLVGRNPAALSRSYPAQHVCAYEDLEAEGAGYDALLHLAVLNNDVSAPEEAFHSTNVDFLLDVLAKCRRARIPIFFNVSSTHALDPGRIDPYSASKRAVAERLRGEEDVVTLYMPLIYGDRWSGRLSRLSDLPRPLARLAFQLFATLRPVAHIERLAAHVVACETSEHELVLADGQSRNRVFQLAKQSMDLLFAIAVIAFLWWALLIAWAVVRLQSPGPGIFAQRRVGRDGEKFVCLKFRTMAVGTAEVGTHDVSHDAITPIGRILRRTKFDELPQVANILRGEISLVGPRPCLPVQTELVEARRRRGVFGITPGITGLAQVNGIDMSDPEMLARWDSYYAAMQSLPLDARIVLETLRQPRQLRRQMPRIVPGRAGTPPGSIAPAGEPPGRRTTATDRRAG